MSIRILSDDHQELAVPRAIAEMSSLAKFMLKDATEISLPAPKDVLVRLFEICAKPFEFVPKTAKECKELMFWAILLGIESLQKLAGAKYHAIVG